MPDSSKIHPTALISDEAELGTDVIVGPFAVIEGPVCIGAGSRIGAHAQVIGDVQIGDNCVVGRAAIIGEDPQDLSFDSNSRSGVRIGNNNTIRELVTIHRSTHEQGYTTLGDGNLLMVGVHLGHDVQMGRENILANNCLLGGHVEVGDKVFLGGGTVVHQFVRLGDRCLTQGNSAISKDIPPFLIAYQLNRFGGLNVVGLRRAGLDPSVRVEIRRAVDSLFRSEKPLSTALKEALSRDWCTEAKRLIDFVASESRKGVLAARTGRE